MTSTRDVGPVTAVVKTFTVDVTDGTLDLVLAASVNQPKVSAIEVIPPSSTGGNTEPAVQNAIADVTADEGSAPTTISLTDVFTDAEDDNASLSLSVENNTNTDLVTAAIDGTDLTLTYAAGQVGVAEVTVRATDSGGLFAEDAFAVTVNEIICSPYSTLDCDEIVVSLPYSLDWAQDEGGLEDGSGVGTGFTMVDPPSVNQFPAAPSNPDVPGYEPGNLSVNTSAGTLAITSTKGIQFEKPPVSSDNNTLVNGLGVGFDARQGVLIETTVEGLDFSTSAGGNSQQAGLWFFLDEDNYAKLVVYKTADNGGDVELAVEADDADLVVQDDDANSDGIDFVSLKAGGVTIPDLSGKSVTLRLVTDPAGSRVTAAYSVDGGVPVALGSLAVPPTFFAGLDQDGNAGTEPVSFAGLFATHRRAAAGESITAAFDAFSISALNEVVASVQTLDFGEVTEGSTSGGQTLTLTHGGGSGSPDISVTAIEITGGDFGAVLDGGATLPVTLAAGTSVGVEVTFAPAATGSQTGALQVTHSGSNSPLAVGLSGTGVEGVAAYTATTSQGWNLVGLPLDTPDKSYQAVFAGAQEGTLFGFDGGYQQPDPAVLSPGEGYWLKFSEETVQTVEGGTLTPVTVNLSAGWNLVSGASCSVPLESASDPSGILIDGTLFGFDGGYVQTDLVEQGRGYWVKASGAGAVTLDCSAVAGKVASRTSEPVAEGFAALEVQDAEGRSQRLYFDGRLDRSKSKAAFTMPPLPPAGAFDVRFSDHARLAEASEGLVLVQATHYPLAVALQPHPDRPAAAYVVEEIANGQTRRTHVLAAGQALHLTDSAVTALRLRTQAAELPDAFALQGNYPNPFNPSTTIVFDLPEDADVSVEVFDLLGRKVFALPKRAMTAGAQQKMHVDASMLASGVYLYRVVAKTASRTLVDTAQMTLLK